MTHCDHDVIDRHKEPGCFQPSDMDTSLNKNTSENPRYTLGINYWPHLQKPSPL